MSPIHDYVLVGGGLQSALIAMALSVRRPAARVLIIERDEELCGNHTWCYHPRDVPPSAQGFIDPMVAHRWDGYTVRFPGGERDLAIRYAAITSESARRALEDLSDRSENLDIALCAHAVHLERDQVVLDDGTRHRARLVIDARGPETAPRQDTGYQKFLGCELALENEHGLQRPVLMDATVDQTDGFRFFYLLPFTTTRLLVEDTMFSDTADLDAERARTAIAEYARARGWRVSHTVREERGVLPMPWRRGEHALCEPGPGEPLRAGYRGGFFHPATGYSFPVAARLADQLSRLGPEESVAGVGELLADLRRRQAFAHLLNHMLFQWFSPEKRYHALRRFYRLPPATIERFYALRMSAADRARILVGRPPEGIAWRALPARLLAWRR